MAAQLNYIWLHKPFQHGNQIHSAGLPLSLSLCYDWFPEAAVYKDPAPQWNSHCLGEGNDTYAHKMMDGRKSGNSTGRNLRSLLTKWLHLHTGELLSNNSEIGPCFLHTASSWDYKSFDYKTFIMEADWFTFRCNSKLKGVHKSRHIRLIWAKNSFMPISFAETSVKGNGNRGWTCWKCTGKCSPLRDQLKAAAVSLLRFTWCCHYFENTHTMCCPASLLII